MSRHYPTWLFLLILLALACAGVLPGALKDQIAVAQMLKTLRYETGYYSTIVRDMNEAHDRRIQEKQFGHDETLPAV